MDLGSGLDDLLKANRFLNKVSKFNLKTII